MLEVLKWLGYDVSKANEEQVAKADSIISFFDYFICTIYSGISFYNTSIATYSLKLMISNSALNAAAVSTILLLILNIVSIARVILDLVLKRRRILKSLKQDNILVKAIDRRINWLLVAFGICAVIVFMNIEFINAGIEESLNASVQIMIIAMYVNNMIEIARRKFNAAEIVEETKKINI